MINWIRDCFDKNFKDVDSELPNDHTIHIATCALFLELCYVDGEFDAKERDAIVKIFKNEYKVESGVVEKILELALEEREKSHDVWRFTKSIRDHYPKEAQIRIVELMWKLILVDGKIDPHEDYLVAKLYDLLHVQHDEFIAAKMRALRGEI